MKWRIWGKRLDVPALRTPHARLEQMYSPRPYSQVWLWRNILGAMPLHSSGARGKYMSEPFHESDVEEPGFDDAFPGYDEL